ncbi:hypothetical protein [Paenibacillus sp. LjRoot56]|uniref:hypothetical protein n=1 Tax=Paenibacillus sp. LjRoot56 TaxID=3342333 RepID=UPI003ED0D7AA
MKRLLSLLIIAFTLILTTACTATTQVNPDVSQGGNAPELSGKVKKALFVGRESGGDGISIKHLKTLGFEVSVMTDKELTAAEALKYSLVFVSSTVNSGRVSNKLIASPIPVIYAESQNIGDVALSGKETDTDNGDFTGKTITIKNSGHPMAAGLNGNVDIYNLDGKIGFVVPSKEAVIVASAPDDDQRAVICAFEKGMKNLNNEPVLARQVYFYLVSGEEINQTDEGWKLFDAAVKWAIGSK